MPEARRQEGRTRRTPGRPGEPSKEPGNQESGAGSPERPERLRINPIGDQRSLGRFVESRDGQESSRKARGPKGGSWDSRRGLGAQMAMGPSISRHVVSVNLSKSLRCWWTAPSS